jgi:H+/Cl- antiporter ClcA
MPRKYIVLLILFCIALNAAGFLWKLFEPILLYDEIAHFVTPFTLVLILAEIVYRSGGDDDFFNTPRRAVITGSVIGLLSATGWEGIEILMSLVGVPISNTLQDSMFDIVLGVLGGAVGAWAADRYLDRIFGRSRTNPHQPRVR